jgi:hypothetical protein
MTTNLIFQNHEIEKISMDYKNTISWSMVAQVEYMEIAIILVLDTNASYQAFKPPT